MSNNRQRQTVKLQVEWDTLLFFGGLFILVEVCAALGLLQLIGDVLADYIKTQPEDDQLTVAITLILWVSAFTSAFLDNIPVRFHATTYCFFAFQLF